MSSVYFKVLRYGLISLFLFMLVIMPINIISSSLSEPLFEKEILGKYYAQPTLQIQSQPSQIMYFATTSELPYLILAVGEVQGDQLVWSTQSSEGGWIIILVFIFGGYSGIRWRKYSIWGTLRR